MARDRSAPARRLPVDAAPGAVRPAPAGSSAAVRGPASPADARAEALLSDPSLTAVGLLVEVQAGLVAAYEPDLEAVGLTGSSFEVLIRLGRSPGHRLRMAELSAQCTLTSSGLTRVVDRLESAGLVVREPCPTDRRGYFATLTPAGCGLLVEVLPAHLATVERTLTGVLDPEELAALLAALRKVRSVVRPGSDPAVAALAPD